MPFTPIHMGPGILVKGVMRGSFSLMVFGWTQIVMDLQPLIVMLTGKGQLHGFTHTYIGALLIAVISALTGKHLSQFGLRVLHIGPNAKTRIPWTVAVISAVIGSFSHVFLDSIMHSDLQPFSPINSTNPAWGIISISVLHYLCLYSGLLGAVLYYYISWRINNKAQGN